VRRNSEDEGADGRIILKVNLTAILHIELNIERQQIEEM
jgi:hypothetical protein